jgi:hypothetical protein
MFANADTVDVSIRTSFENLIQQIASPAVKLRATPVQGID